MKKVYLTAIEDSPYRPPMILEVFDNKLKAKTFADDFEKMNDWVDFVFIIEKELK